MPDDEAISRPADPDGAGALSGDSDESSDQDAEAIHTGERLAAAVARLDEEDRLLLYLSVRHRVPDDKLAGFLDTDLPTLSRRRAHVIERITDELGMRSVSELATVLATLPELPADAWGVSPADLGVDATPDAEAPSEDSSADTEESEETAGEPRRRSRRRRVGLRVGAVAIPVAALGGAVAVLAASDRAGSNDPSPISGAQQRGAAGSEDRAPFVPLGGRPPEGAVEAGGATTFLVARLERRTDLRARPNGRRRARMAPRTRFGSPRVFSVVRRKEGWLGVLAPELPNGQVGWIPAGNARLNRVRYSLHADLSGRRLSVLRDGRVTRQMEITIGARGTPTPAGRFGVTDKLLVTNRDSPYGCCVLALTGHQPKVPEDWPGGDRLAIHASRDKDTLGAAVSLGCMRATADQMRWLVEAIPLGTPVFVGYRPPSQGGRGAESAAPFPAR